MPPIAFSSFWRSSAVSGSFWSSSIASGPPAITCVGDRRQTMRGESKLTAHTKREQRAHIFLGSISTQVVRARKGAREWWWQSKNLNNANEISKQRIMTQRREHNFSPVPPVNRQTAHRGQRVPGEGGAGNRSTAAHGAERHKAKDHA